MNKPDDGLPIFVDPNKQPKPPDRDLKAIVDEAIERDERIERVGRERAERIDRVGRALYGWLWSGKLNTEEWDIGRANRTDRHPAVIDLPPSGKEAATIAQACFRYRASHEQTGQVIHWLNNLWLNDVRILDASASEFDAWFLREFPDVSTQRRKDTVRELRESGRRPRGHGGNLTWEKFCDLVREQSGQDCNDRTIQRDGRGCRTGVQPRGAHFRPPKSRQNGGRSGPPVQSLQPRLIAP